MPFKRAGWLQPAGYAAQVIEAAVSMPFKRAGWLQLDWVTVDDDGQEFQCPLSGLVGCNC